MRRLVQSLALTTCLTGNLATAASAQSSGASHLTARPRPPVEQVSVGLSRLVVPGGRDALLYVPSGYRASRPAPLLVLLHGATQTADLWSRTDDFFRLADELGLVLLMPNSVGSSWDLMRGRYGPDVVRLDSSLARVFRRCNINPRVIALGGFSDGASYALSLGAGNGDLFSALIAFSPGYFMPASRQGSPRIYMVHGTRDRILPIDQTSRQLRPQLESEGYRVTYHEFEGGHTIRPEDAREALAWLVSPSGP